jgi:thymidine kinase
MNKLYFRYGTMKCGKTVQLLVEAYSYKNDDICLIKSSIDTRSEKISSRICGLSREANIILKPDDVLPDLKKYKCVFVDEAQFLTSDQVYELFKVSNYTSVICYGLRTDYKGELFSGSKALFQYADEISEIKNICHYCHNRSSFNIRLNNGKRVDEGPQVVIGDESYNPVCKKCFIEIPLEK